MNIETGFADFCLEKQDIKTAQSRQAIVSCIDLTLLDEKATEQQISELQFKANQYKVAALCIYPQHLAFLAPQDICKRATVLNFPSGDLPAALVMSQLEDTLSAYPVDEIDYVFPYSLYLKGYKQQALERCRQALSLCQHRNVLFKVIVETGQFTESDSLYILARELIDLGCDFLKTSTGKIAIGATPLSAYTLLKAIQDSGASVGFKASGGVRKTEDALLYAEMATLLLKKEIAPSWFRIGASSLLDELITA